MEGFTREEIGAVLTVVKAFIDRKRFEGNYDYFITSAQESESKFIFSILDIAFDEVARGNDLVFYIGEILIMLEGYFKTKAQILILARAYLVEKGFEDSNHFWVNDIEPVNNKDYEVRILFGNMGYNYYTKEVSKADLESYIEKHWKR